jgi:DNA-binding NarL/FixJ family response regulator
MRDVAATPGFAVVPPGILLGDAGEHRARRWTGEGTLMPVSPVRLAVIGANDIIMRGFRALVAEHPGRVQLVAWPPGPDGPEPEVVLYDAIALQHPQAHDGEPHEFEALVTERSAAVVVLARDLRPDLAARALARGADGCVSLALGVPVGEAEGDPVAAEARRLAKSAGLSAREAEILGLITLGLHNVEIAEKCFLSINSVKTYIRHAYRKIGAEDRAQAVVWCLQHGFPPPDH